MKKILIILLVVVVSAAGCAQSIEEPSPQTSVSEPAIITSAMESTKTVEVPATPSAKSESANITSARPGILPGIDLNDDYQRVRTATFIIAANNSTEAAKSQADYVCDGVDDNVQIQAAVDALADTGGDIYLSSGTYNVATNGINLNKNSVSLCGTRSSIIRLADNQTAGYVIAATANVCAVDGITIDGNFAGQQLTWRSYYGIMITNYANDSVVRNCEIKNIGNDAIITTGGNSRTFILENSIHDCGEGILFQVSDWCRALGNVLYDIGTGSSTTQDGIEPSGCDYCVVANNSLYNISGSAIDVFRNSHYNTIEGNTISEFCQDAVGTAAISVEGYDSTCDYNKVTSNTIIEGTSAGIRFQNASYGVISHNVILGTKGIHRQNIRVEKSSINNNIIGNNVNGGNVGIQVLSGCPATIIGNTVIGSYRGIQSSGGSSVISGNRVVGVKLGESCMIIEGSYNTVTGNFIDGNAMDDAYGIRALGDYDIITGNIIHNLPVQGNRLLLVLGDNSRVYENQVD